ncbi:MAG: ABC transporter permease [Clostridia bacterium]|nr:ABC transporter permease [Clostridia bacterium]
MTDNVKTAVPKEAHAGKTPWVTITKRDGVGLKRRILIRVAAIFAALVLGSIITPLVTGDNPLSIYGTMVKGAFSEYRIWGTAQSFVMLLGISLAVTPAFKMKFWNIGAEGQVLAGALATAAVMVGLGGKVPDWTVTLVMIAAGIGAGTLWGVIPAVFKAFWKTNETLFTLMLNYVAIQLVEYFLKIADKSGSNTVGPSLLTHGRLPVLFGQQYMLNIIIVTLLTAFIYVYMYYSKHGYEIAVVGESENTARYVGINVKKVIIRTMALSGAICGLMGLLLVGATSYSIDANLAGGNGFTAIMVSWLAKFNPLLMILTAALIVFMSRGAEEVSTKFGLNSSYSDILTGIILFFIIGCEFFINYEVHFNRRRGAKKEEAE